MLVIIKKAAGVFAGSLFLSSAVTEKVLFQMNEPDSIFSSSSVNLITGFIHRFQPVALKHSDDKVHN